MHNSVGDVALGCVFLLECMQVIHSEIFKNDRPCVSLVPKVISSELSVDNKFGAFEQHSGEEGRLIHRNFLMGVRLPLHKRFIEMSPFNKGLQLQSY